MKKKENKERTEELFKTIQLINSGRELENIEKLHKQQLKKYHNHEGE